MSRILSSPSKKVEIYTKAEQETVIEIQKKERNNILTGQSKERNS